MVTEKQLPATGPSPYLTGLLCRCPRCGKGKLFDGFLTLKPDCESCGLDFTFADAGDGPAIFVIMIAGAIVVGAALITEVKYQPPYWVHAALAPADPDRDALAATRAEKPAYLTAVSSQGIASEAHPAS